MWNEIFVADDSLYEYPSNICFTFACFETNSLRFFARKYTCHSYDTNARNA